MAESAEQQARRFKKALRTIARLPDHELWWDIAREMCDLITEQGLSPAEAQRQAIATIDARDGTGACAP